MTLVTSSIYAIVPYNINTLHSNYQLLAVVLLSDKAKVLEPSPPYPGLRAPKRTQSLQG